jgi:hypothetical protein
MQHMSIEQVAAVETTVNECCGPSAHLQPEEPEANSVMCDRCMRCWHVHSMCLDQTFLQEVRRAMAEDKVWYCKECKQLGEASASTALPDLLGHYRVSWHECVEPADNISVVAGCNPQGLQRATDGVQTGPDYNTSILTALEAQALQERRHDITIGQQGRDKLVIHTTPCDPHADIHPTGTHELVIRPIGMIDQQGRHHTTELACLIAPDGRCMHKLTLSRAAMLLDAFESTKLRRPGLFRSLQAAGFAEEVHQLMLRYHDTSKQRLPQGLWAALHHILRSSMRGARDRWTSIQASQHTAVT